MALALYAVVKADQMVHFEAEFKALSNGESINTKSSIALLYPFMEKASSESAADWPTGTQ